MSKSAFDYWLSGFVVFWMVCGALVGGAGCVAMIGWGSELRSASEATPLLIAWTALVAATGAISWAGLLPATAAAWAAAKGIRSPRSGDEPRRNFLWLGLTGGVVVLVVSLALVFEPQVAPLTVAWPLGGQQSTRVGLVTVFTSAPPMIAIAAIWLQAIQAVYDARRTGTSEAKLVTTYLDQRERTRGLLSYVGVVIGAGVLASGILRQGMLAGPYATAKEFPEALVLAYGAFFTLVLVICYVPAHLMLRHAGGVLLARALEPLEGGTAPAVAEPGPAAIASAATLGEWQKRRKDLVELLHLDHDPQGSIRSAVAILAPIIAGFASMAFAK